MVNFKRFLRHALASPFTVRRRFPVDALARIEAAVVAAEAGHTGEIRVVIEHALPLAKVWRGQTPRERAQRLFGELGVWDTEANTGVLIYLLMAERDLEIVADRGLAAKVTQAQWEAIARMMETAFAAGEFERGARAGVDAVGALLARHFPVTTGHNPDELPNRPVLT